MPVTEIHFSAVLTTRLNFHLFETISFTPTPAHATSAGVRCQRLYYHPDLTGAAWHRSVPPLMQYGGGVSRGLGPRAASTTEFALFDFEKAVRK